MNPTPDHTYRNHWNERYKGDGFAFGKAPNEFFKDWLPRFSPGTILMPAEGEGRNGVYAATLGWKVTAFDLSEEGKTKATRLARENDVKLTYTVGDFADLQYDVSSFDAIGLIYAHFPAAQKSAFHQRLVSYLKPGGVVIFEAFGKGHLEYNARNPQVGGPREIDMLFSVEELKEDFNGLDFLLEPSERAIYLNEGERHSGMGSVIRFVGTKKT